MLKDVRGYSTAKADALAATSLVEILHPVKHAICLVEQDLCILVSSSMFTCHEFFNKQKEQAMQLIVLSVLVALRNHIDKTGLLPGVRAYLKGKYVLSK